MFYVPKIGTGKLIFCPSFPLIVRLVEKTAQKKVKTLRDTTLFSFKSVTINFFKIFMSNIDNLGATVDLNILSLLLENPQTEFCMEVTDKTLELM